MAWPPPPDSGNALKKTKLFYWFHPETATATIMYLILSGCQICALPCTELVGLVLPQPDLVKKNWQLTVIGGDKKYGGEGMSTNICQLPQIDFSRIWYLYFRVHRHRNALKVFRQVRCMLIFVIGIAALSVSLNWLTYWILQSNQSIYIKKHFNNYSMK